MLKLWPFAISVFFKMKYLHYNGSYPVFLLNLVSAQYLYIFSITGTFCSGPILFALLPSIDVIRYRLALGHVQGHYREIRI